MVATYPDDAAFSNTAYPIIGTVTYTNTGSTTTFTLASPVSYSGEVLAIVDGIVQDTTSYSLTSSKTGVSFYSALFASNLTLKSISVPARFRVSRTMSTTKTASYGNNFIRTINGNNYVINGVQTAWALPDDSSAPTKNELMVAVSGVVQASQHYTFPSATLGLGGIDISPALGANDTLQIRVFNSQDIIYTRCMSMIDRKPDKGLGSTKRYDVTLFESQAGYEKRRLRSRRGKREWDLTYTNISGLEKEAIETFFDARSGGYEAFLFDLSHISETGTASVRFDGGLDVKQNAVRSSAAYDKFYTVSFRLVEVYD